MIKRKIIYVVLFLFVHKEVKSIEPLTGLIIAGTIIAGAWKTSTGKIAFGYMLCKASQTAPGRYLVIKTQSQSSSMIKKYMQKKQKLIKDNLSRKLVDYKATASELMKNFRTISTGVQEVEQVSGQQVLVSKSFSDFFSGLKNIEKKIFSTSSTISKDRTCGMASAEGLKITANFVQNNIRQKIFIYSDSAVELGKKEFWRGAFFGGIAGSGIVTYIHKKMEKNPLVK